MTESPHPAIGIDLGTTFSALSYLDSNGRPCTARNAEGEITTPSAVFFDKTHPVVGIEAVEAGIIEPERLAMFAKRDIGEQSYEKEIRGEHLPPEVIQALVLKKLIDDAQPKLGKITKAVVTVPAFFNEPCRKATQDAGRLIGLEVLDIINEPTAAAITYGVESGFLSPDGTSEKKQRVLVYDLGGGTFDVTIMEIEGMRYQAVATAGDVYLGGIDWDTRIVDYAAEQFMLEHDDVDPREDPTWTQEMMKKAAQAKHALSQRDEFPIAFAHEGKRFKISLSREKFEFLTSDLVDRTMMTVNLALRDAGISWEDLSQVILVGGSTRMPMVVSAVEAAAELKVDRSLSPDEAISQGAAIYAGLLLKQGATSMEGMSVRNVNSHDLGVLAIETSTGRPRRKVMIARNSPLPAQTSFRFKTHKTNQSNVKIQVVEGGDDSGNDATQIGLCMVDQLPKNLPQGTIIDVEFQYETDGRLGVTANMPDIPREVRLVFTREAGLKPESFDYWQKRLAEGFPDSSVGLRDPEPEAGTVSEQQKDSDEAIESEKSDTPMAAIVVAPEKAAVEPSKDSPPAEEASPAKPAATAMPDFSSLGRRKKKPVNGPNDSSSKTPVVNPQTETPKSADQPQPVGKQKPKKPQSSKPKPDRAKGETPAAFPDFSSLRSAKKKK